MSTIYINGRFLTQSLSGVQRYAREIVRELDRKLSAGGGTSRWVLLAPPGADDDLADSLRAVQLERIGGASGHLWDQAVLPRRARDGALLSLCSTGPVLHRRHLVVIHDAAVFRTPDHFGFLYGQVHRTLGRLLARSASLATVSAFSRRELAEVLSLDPASILLAPAGWEQLTTITPDVGVIDRLGLAGSPYFLTVGNQTRNKNIALAAQAFSRLPPGTCAKLVVVGAAAAAVFGGGPKVASRQVIMAGRRTDEELAALYSHASALVFPSFYEGFGSPPLEAMARDCPVLASTAEAVQEVCADAAEYFDPRDADGLATLMTRRLAGDPPRGQCLERGRRRLGLYSYSRTAEVLMERMLTL